MHTYIPYGSVQDFILNRILIQVLLFIYLLLLQENWDGIYFANNGRIIQTKYFTTVFCLYDAPKLNLQTAPWGTVIYFPN